MPESQFNYLFTLKNAHLSSNSYNFRMQPNIPMKFSGYVARILLCKRCKFGEKIYYNFADIEFFLGDYFFGVPCSFLLLRFFGEWSFYLFYTVKCLFLPQNGPLCVWHPGYFRTQKGRWKYGLQLPNPAYATEVKTTECFCVAYPPQEQYINARHWRPDELQYI